MPPCTLPEVDVGHAGSTSGLLKATQQLGSAVGAAAIGTLFFAIQPEGSLHGEQAIRAFSLSAAVIALILLVVGVVVLAIPRKLRIRGSSALAAGK